MHTCLRIFITHTLRYESVCLSEKLNALGQAEWIDIGTDICAVVMISVLAVVMAVVLDIVLAVVLTVVLTVVLAVVLAIALAVVLAVVLAVKFRCKTQAAPMSLENLKTAQAARAKQVKYTSIKILLILAM